MVGIKDFEMPKSCDVCPFMNTNDDLMTDDYRYMQCDYPHMGEFVSDYIARRHPECPLREVEAIPKSNVYNAFLEIMKYEHEGFINISLARLDEILKECEVVEDGKTKM